MHLGNFKFGTYRATQVRPVVAVVPVKYRWQTNLTTQAPFFCSLGSQLALSLRWDLYVLLYWPSNLQNYVFARYLDSVLYESDQVQTERSKHTRKRFRNSLWRYSTASQQSKRFTSFPKAKFEISQMHRFVSRFPKYKGHYYVVRRMHS